MYSHYSNSLIVVVRVFSGVAVSGMTADARQMIKQARAEAQSHRFTHDEPMPVMSLTQAVCDLALRFGEGDDQEEEAMSRPFGVALLFAGIDKTGPCLFQTEPSGTFTRYKAMAIGSGSEGANNTLLQEYHSAMTLQEAEVLALTTLRQVMEEKLDATNIEVASVTPQRKFHIYTKEELAQIISRLPAATVPGQPPQ